MSAVKYYSKASQKEIKESTHINDYNECGGCVYRHCLSQLAKWARQGPNSEFLDTVMNIIESHSHASTSET